MILLWEILGLQFHFHIAYIYLIIYFYLVCEAIGTAATSGLLCHTFLVVWIAILAFAVTSSFRLHRICLFFTCLLVVVAVVVVGALSNSSNSSCIYICKQILSG
jgi:hypothetical protein